MREMLVEVLRLHPHPNAARYHGCVVEDGKITGLCFDRYSMTLSKEDRRDGNDARR